MNDRVPPQSREAEQAVLGAMLISRDAIEQVVEVIKGPDFYQPAHEIIFDSILDLYTAGKPVDMVTVAGDLTRREVLHKVGGAPYLHTLANEVMVAANADYYAHQIREAAQFRRMIEAGTKIVQRGYAQSSDADAAYDASMADLLSVERLDRGQDYALVGDLLTGRLDDIEAHTPGELRGVPTGFYDLDELTNGLHPGQMICVAGRPAMGKSTLAIDFARAAAIHHNLTTAVFSLEMGRDEIVNRIISAESKVALSKINSGLLSDDDWTRIAQHCAPIASAPLFIDDSSNLTMTAIRSKARRLRQRHDLRLIVVDYLQLMSSGKTVESRQVEVSEFSRQIKVLAKELEVPIVVLSQLNRGVENRASKRPMLSDLRESGAIEQDSDVVLMLHREDMYDPESSRPGEADLIVAKHRNGACRDITVVAQLHYSRFVDMAA